MSSRIEALCILVLCIFGVYRSGIAEEARFNLARQFEHQFFHHHTIVRPRVPQRFVRPKHFFDRRPAAAPSRRPTTVCNTCLARSAPHADPLLRVNTPGPAARSAGSPPAPPAPAGIAWPETSAPAADTRLRASACRGCRATASDLRGQVRRPTRISLSRAHSEPAAQYRPP